MRTDELVSMLATGAQPVAAGVTARRHIVALAWGGLVTTLVMAVFLGVRADIAVAAQTSMFWVKLAFPLSVALAAIIAATRLARPGVALGRAPLGLIAPVAVIVVMAIFALATAQPDQRLALILSPTWKVCPWLIALLSMPLLTGTLWAMRGLAPTRPVVAGATAGLLAGAVAATIYALHCTQMAAPFLATWYVLGMLIPAAAGALLGPRLLRW